MLSLLISALIATGLAIALKAAQLSPVITNWLSLTGFLGSFFLIGFLVRKRMAVAHGALQDSMEVAQRRIQRKIQQFQNKPGGNVKQLQQQLERDQKLMCQQGLELTKGLEPFRKWSMLTGRQIATMRLQFHYQLKDFDKVDEILATCGFLRGPLMLDPTVVAMRMARSYKNGDVAAARKVFKRKIIWFRGDRGTLLYGLMSWIYVQVGQPEEAQRILLKAKDATRNETLIRNWEHLTNDRAKSFSNAGLGDPWYGLHLENPPEMKQQRTRGKGRRPQGF